MLGIVFGTIGVLAIGTVALLGNLKKEVNNLIEDYKKEIEEKDLLIDRLRLEVKCLSGANEVLRNRPIEIKKADAEQNIDFDMKF